MKISGKISFKLILVIGFLLVLLLAISKILQTREVAKSYFERSSQDQIKKIIIDKHKANIELENKITAYQQSLQNQAQSLHTRRIQFAKKLGDELSKRVRTLKMNGATIKLELEKLVELTETGMSRAFFIAETNPGEGFFKIKDIASGGELSRILLSLRQILSSHDSISIFLFDEISRSPWR